MDLIKDILTRAQTQAILYSLPMHLFKTLDYSLANKVEEHIQGVGIGPNTLVEALTEQEREDLVRALMAECQSVIHHEFIKDVVRRCSTGPHIESTSSPASFIGDADKHLLVAFEQFFTEEAALEFIVASPLLIAVMQSSHHTVFHPALEGAYQGSDNTGLVGEIDVNDKRIPVYVYLMNQHFEPGQYKTDWIIVGRSPKEEIRHDFMTYQKITFNLPDFAW